MLNQIRGPVFDLLSQARRYGAGSNSSFLFTLYLFLSLSRIEAAGLEEKDHKGISMSTIVFRVAQKECWAGSMLGPLDFVRGRPGLGPWYNKCLHLQFPCLCFKKSAGESIYLIKKHSVDLRY